MSAGGKPDPEPYLKQWRRNRRFAQTIDSSYRDWQVNVIFYASLHAVNAALAKLGVEVSNHEARNDQIKENAALTSIREQYLNLYRICRITRYDPDPDLWLPADYTTVSDMAHALLRPIENGLHEILSAIAYTPLKLSS